METNEEGPIEMLLDAIAVGARTPKRDDAKMELIEALYQCDTAQS